MHRERLLHSRHSNRIIVAPHKPTNPRKPPRFFRRSSVSYANSGGNIYLIPTYDAACNLASPGVSCSVREMNLSGCDKL